MSLADTITAAANAAAAAVLPAFPDRCDLIKPTLQDGGASGDSLTTSTVASNLKCLYEAKGNISQVTIGGRVYSATHSLMIERTAQSLAITPEYKIRVHARGGNAALVFEDPIVEGGSFSPMIFIDATIVKQGYQQ